MSATVRRLIRDATVEALRASSLIQALPDPPAVETSRVLPLDSSALPRILVYMRGETSQERLAPAPRSYLVVGELVVEHAAEFSHERVAEDELDAIAAAIEPTLSELEATRWGLLRDGVPIVRESDYRATEISVSNEGTYQAVSIVLRFELQYEREIGQSTLDRLALAATQTNVGDGPPVLDDTHFPT